MKPLLIRTPAQYRRFEGILKQIEANAEDLSAEKLNCNEPVIKVRLSNKILFLQERMERIQQAMNEYDNK